MSILRGHEDLQPKAIVGFDMGFALVQCGQEVKRYRLTVGPGGSINARPAEEARESIDQLGSVPEIRARRYAGVDQIGFHGLDQVE